MNILQLSRLKQEYKMSKNTKLYQQHDMFLKQKISITISQISNNYKINHVSPKHSIFLIVSHLVLVLLYKLGCKTYLFLPNHYLVLQTNARRHWSIFKKFGSSISQCSGSLTNKNCRKMISHSQKQFMQHFFCDTKDGEETEA